MGKEPLNNVVSRFSGLPCVTITFQAIGHTHQAGAST